MKERVLYERRLGEEAFVYVEKNEFNEFYDVFEIPVYGGKPFISSSFKTLGEAINYSNKLG